MNFTVTVLINLKAAIKWIYSNSVRCLGDRQLVDLITRATHDATTVCARRTRIYDSVCIGYKAVLYLSLLSRYFACDKTHAIIEWLLGHL